MERGKEEMTTFIIKEKENLIPWDQLNEEQRIAILTFELGDLILKKGEFRRTVDSINKMFKETQGDDIVRTDADAVNFLMKFNWLIPIVSDKLQVVLKQKPEPGEEIVPRDQFYKEIQEAGPVANLVDIVSPYIPVPIEGGILTRSKVARLGARTIDPTKYHRTIVEDETIIVAGFVIDYGQVWSNSLMLHRLANIMNLTKLFHSEYHKKHYPVRLETSNLIKLTAKIRNHEDLIDIVQNSTEFNLEVIDKFIKSRTDLGLPKASISPQRQKEINNQFPGYLLDALPIKAIFGDYPVFGKPSDLPAQRESWIRRNPYLLYYHWTDNPNQTVLLEKLQHEDFVRSLQRKHQERRLYLTIVENMYETAINEQLTPFALAKLRKKADNLGVFIQDILTTKEKTQVEDFITQTRKHRENWTQNKCAHFALRLRYDTDITLNERFKVFSDMIQTFGTRPEPETRRILCSQCGFNLGCEHEVLLLKRYQDKEKYNEITDKLENEYYAEETVDFIYCQFCGRKIADADPGAEEDIHFDEETKTRIVGTVIEDQSQKSIDLLNLIKTTLVHTGLQGRLNLKGILNFISFHIFNMYNQIEAMELKTMDTLLQKKMWALAFIYARIIQEIIFSKFRINFRRSMLPNKEPLNPKERETVSHGNISIYKLVVLRIIQQNDPKFFQEIQMRKMKLTFALTSAFNTLRRDVFRKDLSEIARLIELHGVSTIPRKLYQITKGEENRASEEDSIKKKVEKILHKPESILFTNELLLRAFKFRLQTVANMINKNITLVGWNPALNIKKLNQLYESRTFWSKELYYRYFPEIKPPFLTADNDSILNLYQAWNYCENGTKQKWNITILFREKEEIRVKSGDFKNKLKIQKKTFDLDYSPKEDYEYLSFSETVNILNVNEYSRDLENTDCKEIKSETKKVFLDKKERENLRILALDVYEDSRLKSLLLQACSGEPGHIVSAGNVHVVCGIDQIDLKLVKKFRKELEKLYEQEEKVEHKILPPKLETFSIKKVKDFDFDTKTLNQETLNELVRKLVKLSGISGIKEEQLRESIRNLGRFTESFKEVVQQLPKEDREAREKELIRDQNLVRIQELINIITQLHQYYSIIKTHPNGLFFPTSPSHEFLVKYVNEKKNKEFSKNIPRVFNFNTYDELKYDKDFTLFRKIIIFLNIFIRLADMIVETRLEARFVAEFLSIIREAEIIADATENQIEIIQENLDLLRRKRTEKFLKMTPEEKIAQGLMAVGLEEQIEILDENIKEKNKEEEQALIETYDDEEEQKIQDEDFESLDNVDYEIRAFELF